MARSTVNQDSLPLAFQVLLDRTRKLFEREGSVPSSLYVYAPDRDPSEYKCACMPISQFLRDSMAKQMVEGTMVACAAAGASAICTITEAYGFTGSPEIDNDQFQLAIKLASESRLEEHPLAVRKVTALYETSLVSWAAEADVCDGMLSAWNYFIDGQDTQLVSRMAGTYSKAMKFLNDEEGAFIK